MRTFLFRWSLIAALGMLVAVSPGLTPVAQATPKKAAPANRRGPQKAKGHAAARTHASTKGHAKTQGRVATKKVFLERHVVAIKGGLPNVQALGALVIDESGRELYSRNPDKERPIASISKLAATLVVMDKGLELEGLSTIAKGDLDVARGGAKSRLLEGMTLSNRDLLHAALMGSDNRAIPALGRAVKLSPSQLAAAMSAKARALGLKNTRFHDPTGLSTENVSTPRETIAMLKAVMNHPVLGPITHRLEYDAHPVGKPPITYNNTYKPAQRANIQVLGGKTGYNDDARYCLVIATRIDGRVYFMSFLSNEGKLTRFGDVARVADWIVSRRPQKSAGTATALVSATATAGGAGKMMKASATTARVRSAPVATAAAATDTAGTAAAPAASAGAAAPAGAGDSTPVRGRSDTTSDSTAPALPIGVAAPPAAPAPETAVR